jgi:uncharacterized SAM-binding protein YcdF (DUF218 family)
MSLTPDPDSRAAAASLLARSAALFLGGFLAIGLADSLRAPTFDPTIWLIDLRFLPWALAEALLAVAAATLLAFAWRPAARGWRRHLTGAVCATLTGVAAANGVTFYAVWAEGRIRPDWPVPLSFPIAAVFAALVLASRLSGPARSRAAGLRGAAAPRDSGLRGAGLRGAVIVGCAACWAAAFPLAQEFFFGTTDYARPAQAAVVLGAQVLRDGRPTIALRGRVMTAVALYRRGLVGTLVLSGGRNGSVSQVTAMRALALQQGVPASAVLCDERGVNTAATVRDTVPMLRARGLRRVIAVSDFYHLPRVKLAFASAGLDVLTVPARGGAWIKQTPFLIVRDDAGFWVYLLRSSL